MPPKRNAGESKQGLVITLVFFILTTIGLGVGTYYGFADQEAAHKKEKEALEKQKAAEDTALWRRFMALQLQAYLNGNLNEVDAGDLGVRLRPMYEQGKLGAKEKDKADFVKLMGELEGKLGWDPVAKKPKRIYPDLVKVEQQKVAELEKQLAVLDTAKKAAEARVKEIQDQKDAAEKEYGDKLAKITKDLQQDNTNQVKEVQRLRDLLKKAGEDRAKDKTDAETEVAKARADVRKKDAEVMSLKSALAAKTSEVSQYKKQTVEAPREWRTDWKIIRISGNGLNPYINLGTADNVKPGLTFSVHGVSLDGKPEPTAKATLEVISPIEAHLSRARITAVRDADRDPVLEKDILYNPSWNPHLKKHIALTGIIDLTGNGTDGTAEFVRSLQRQNVIVDSYLDTKKNFTPQGKGMTLETDYLVIGESRGSLAESRDPAFLSNLDKAIKAARDQATKMGIPVVTLPRYLEMIGYRLPKTPESERGRPGYVPGLRPNPRR